MAFKTATRKGTSVIIGIASKSGRGKTYSAIRLARGLVGPKGKIGFLDTETGRGTHYANLTEYFIDELYPPFSPKRYIEKIKEAAEAGFDALIIDSLSHEWSGTGGVLEMADATGKQGLQKWLTPKVEHRKLINALTQLKIHLIFCLRAKDKYVQVPDPEKPGKEKIVNQGIIPIQDDDLLFECTVSVMLDDDTRPGVPRIYKCPADLRPAFPTDQPITEKTGAMIAEWVSGGAVVDRDFELLKMKGREAAIGGAKALRAWFDTLDKQQKIAIKAMLDTELKSAAAAADEMTALAAPPPPADDGLSDEPIDASIRLNGATAPAEPRFDS